MRFLTKAYKSLSDILAKPIPKNRLYQTVIPGNVSDELPVPDHIAKPPYYYKYQEPCLVLGEPVVQTPAVITAMRKTCRLAATILNKCPDVLKPGLTTDELDKFIHNEIIKANGYPSPLRYALFPKSVCTSVNNVICHGIPDDRPLVEGDIVSVDITIFADGVHGDCCRTFSVGEVDEEAKYLMRISELCRDEAIKICGPGVAFNEIGALIESIADEFKLRIVREFVGHGIGTVFHGPPQIIHHRNKCEGIMETGHIFTIEPILVTGRPAFRILEDEWTAATKDDSRGAQYEHTILITQNGAEILTLPADESVRAENEKNCVHSEKM